MNWATGDFREGDAGSVRAAQSFQNYMWKEKLFDLWIRRSGMIVKNATATANEYPEHYRRWATLYRMGVVK